ncbi:hypothetical protein CONCODRAFT_20730, partial [Conidiobolus coronatus NRRL 28638]
MSSSSLYYILKLKEFRDCLSSLEVVELSISSKKVRELVKSLLFNKFDFRSFIENKKYKYDVINKSCEEYNSIKHLLIQANNLEQESAKDDFEYEREDEYNRFIRNPYKCLTKEYLESSDKLQFDLKQFRFRPKILELNCTQHFDYLIYGLCNAFSNINILSICASTFNLSYSINWPLNLKKLEIGENVFGFIDNDNDYIKSDAFGCPQTDIQNLEITPKHLPSLHTLILGSEFPYDLYDGDSEYQFLSFLKLNPQVKSLEIYFYQLKPQNLELISNISNLIKLKLIVYEFENIEAFNAIKTPKLSSLKYLELSLMRDTSILAAIVEQFPNLTYLSYYAKWLKLNNKTLYGPCLEKLENLKTLKLHIYQHKPPKNLNLPKLKI